MPFKGNKGTPLNEERIESQELYAESTRLKRDVWAVQGESR